MIRIAAAILAAASCTSLVQAQTAPSASVAEAAGAALTLSAALLEAERNAPARDVANAGLRAAAAARTVAGLRPNPAITIDVENFAGSGAYGGTEAIETTTALELPLELGGKRSARVAVAEAQLARAGVTAAATRADLRQVVIDAYLAAVAGEARLANARRELEVAESGLAAADARVKAGRASPLERQRAEVTHVIAKNEVAQAERRLTAARANLGARIGQPVIGALDRAWFERIDGYGPPADRAAAGTLALAAAEAELATADAQVRLARANRVPDLRVSAGARRIAESDDTAAVVGLSIPLRLFNSGRASVDQARAERDRAEAQRRVALIDAQADIRTAEADLANAAGTARAATGPALAAAEEAARIARIGYREGKFGQLDLIDAERTLAATRTAAITALTDYHSAQARLERLTARVTTSGDME